MSSAPLTPAEPAKKSWAGLFQSSAPAASHAHPTATSLLSPSSSSSQQPRTQSVASPLSPVSPPEVSKTYSYPPLGTSRKTPSVVQISDVLKRTKMDFSAVWYRPRGLVNRFELLISQTFSFIPYDGQRMNKAFVGRWVINEALSLMKQPLVILIEL